jgi:hypothetical protein
MRLRFSVYFRHLGAGIGPCFHLLSFGKGSTNQAEKETTMRDLGGLSVSLSVAI